MPSTISGSGVNLTSDQTVAGIKTWTADSIRSDPSKTLLIGSLTAPDISGTAFTGGAQVEISSRNADAKLPFMVVGAYRVGSSGDRYITSISQAGGMFSNSYIDLNAGSTSSPVGDTQFSFRINSDVPVAMSLAVPFDWTTGFLIDGWGTPDGQGATKKVFSLNSGGTVRLTNPYGSHGADAMSVPQLILSDTSYDTSDTTYRSLGVRFLDGVGGIGTWNDAGSVWQNTGAYAGNPEIRILPGVVDILGTIKTQGAPLPSVGVNWTGYFYGQASFNRVGVASNGSAASIEFIESDSVRKWLIGTSSGVFSIYDNTGSGTAVDFGAGTGAAHFYRAALFDSSVSGLHVASGTATSCTGATIGSGSKANAGFVTSTTTGTSTIVITFPFTATTGWSIAPTNLTTANLIRQTAKSTTTATISGVTVTGDVIQYVAMPY